MLHELPGRGPGELSSQGGRPQPAPVCRRRRRSPAADHGLIGPATVLSERETELAQLAAQGLSNAEIAERLVLSVRTVETYLYRAMQKMGLSDRRDLRGAIGGHTLPAGSLPRDRRT